NYDQIKKELEKITKKRDDYKKDLRKSEEEKRKINLEIQKNMSKKRKLNSEKLTSAGDENAFNACGEKRPEGSKVNRINFGPTLHNDRLFYNDTVYKRINLWRLFQEKENKPRFSKLVLSDISIHLVFTSVHTRQIENLVGIAPWLYYQQIKKTQNDITPEEILVDMNKLDKLELKDYFQILAEYYGKLIYFLSTQFLLETGQTGLPVYISNRQIEITYRYDANIENTYKIANIIAQQLIQAQGQDGGGALMEENQNDNL
ncbi:7262_t:CDS:2, partial [Racocetra persica]